MAFHIVFPSFPFRPVMLRELLMQQVETEAERHAQARLGEMHDLFELFTGWYDDMRRLDTDRLVQLPTLGAKVQKVPEMKDRLARFGGRPDQRGD